MPAKKLREYNKKRDFKKTREPKGVLGRNKPERRIFVIQEHHARRLHYDLRLEWDGVLMSWAVPKGPSMNPGEKRLAVQTEDHPLGYEKFHGKIPEGEYGAGEMFIWDKGTWEIAPGRDVEAGLKKGHLEFIIHGKKVKGKFDLVKTHYGGSKNSWLLIKRSDEKVKPESTMKMPDFIKPQLAKLVTAPPTDDGQWIHEVKYDGYRIQAHIRNGVGTLYTRNGLDWSNSFPFINTAIEKLKVQNAIFDGEIVANDSKGRSHFQNLQNSIKGKDDKHLIYYIFDLLFLNGEDLRERPFLERKKLLSSVLKSGPKNLVLSEHFSSPAEDFFATMCEQELEGMISKRADSTYHSGRGDAWVKTKCGNRQEFVIGGWTQPKGGRTGLGALLVGVYEKKKFRYAGRVGTGFDTATLKDLKKRLSGLEQEDSPFDIASPKGKDTHWVKPELACEVSFAQWTDEGILRAPVFKGLREDKPIRQMHKEEAVNITSPDKILFKKEKITKGQVANFYETVAKTMLPYLKDRPLSLVRCPNGTSGQCFYQKHLKAGAEDYEITVSTKEELLALIQLNAFEIHAWNCHKDNVMAPDQIVMDLDPGPGVPWRTVRGAAFELKEMLEDLGLKSFVKVTGGKGLHLHIPIAPAYSWDEVKAFAQSLALRLVEVSPKLYVANMSKKLRNKKIFVDYLRNGYGATAVAPYSLRAKDTSSCAVPLTWEELKKVKSGDAFDLKGALRKIKTRRSDPWKGMLKMKQTIKVLDAHQKAAA